jgi:hypothetical protein
MSRVWRTIAAVTMTAAIAALGAASAASLGPVRSTSLASFRSVGTVPIPTTTTTLPPGVQILLCDTFSIAASTGTALNQRPVQPPATCGGRQWTVLSGNWLIQSGEVSVSASRSLVTITSGARNISAQATVLHGNVATAQSGVAIDYSNRVKNFLVGAINGSGSVQLLMVTNAGDPVVLASSTATITGNDVIRITRIDTKVTVSLNGTVRVTYTLTAADAANLTRGTRTGLYFNYNSLNAVRFTNFLATTPTAP